MMINDIVVIGVFAILCIGVWIAIKCREKEEENGQSQNK